MATFTNDEGNLVSIDERAALSTLYDYIFGGLGRSLSTEALREVYLCGDGFGDTREPVRRAEVLAYMAGGWDWSHVRDSSPQAIHRALVCLCEKLAEQAAEVTA
jgi:hypothetical protein